MIALGLYSMSSVNKFNKAKCSFLFVASVISLSIDELENKSQNFSMEP